MRTSGGVLALAVAAWALLWAGSRALVEVRGPSMLPTLRPGQRLLTVPAAPLPLTAGQVVVVADPADPHHLVVKRLARVEGARVVVLGDNPSRSTDSRAWGSLPRASVRRVAVLRWPRPSRAGLAAPTRRAGTGGA